MQQAVSESEASAGQLACIQQHMQVLLRLCVFIVMTSQVETASCYEALDDVLSVPGITSAFLGEFQS